MKLLPVLLVAFVIVSLPFQARSEPTWGPFFPFDPSIEVRFGMENNSCYYQFRNNSLTYTLNGLVWFWGPDALQHYNFLKHSVRSGGLSEIVLAQLPENTPCDIYGLNFKKIKASWP